MANIQITNNIKNIVDVLNKIETQLDKLPEEFYKEFKKATPIKTGYARRNTRLEDNSIKADYPYAYVLDKGRHMTPKGMRGSEQAPDGMTKPTIEWLKKRLRKILKGS